MFIALLAVLTDKSRRGSQSTTEVVQGMLSLDIWPQVVGRDWSESQAHTMGQNG